MTLAQIGFYNDTMVRVLTDLLAQPNADRKRIFATLQSISQTNVAAKAVLEQRLATNPRAAQYYQGQLRLWRYSRAGAKASDH
jgi:hypothetical protein